MLNLQFEIEKTRKKMIEMAFTFGYTSVQAIESSQYLDYLLNILAMKERNKKVTDMGYLQL